MKDFEEMTDEPLLARGELLAAQLKHEGTVLMALYRQIAEREGLELVILDEGFADVEFRMDFTSRTILELLETRSQTVASTGKEFGTLASEFRNLFKR